MSNTYRPAVGDRVRVIHEGEIEQISKKGDLYRVGGGGFGRSFTWFHQDDTETVLSVEKLQDPEPQWANGDVVRSTPLAIRSIARIGGIWLTVENHIQIMDHELSLRWKLGDVEILYKADAPKAA